MWQFYFSRKYSLLRWAEYLISLNDPSFLKFPGIKKVRLILDGFQSPEIVYYESIQWKERIDKPLVTIVPLLGGWKNFTQVYWYTCKKLNKLTNKLAKLNPKRLNNIQLLIIVKQTRKLLLKHFAIGIWGVFIIEPLLTSLEFLKSKFPNLAEHNLLSILTPPKLATHFQEELSLKKIKLNNRKALKRHFKKFRWIPCVDLTDMPWTMDDFINRKKELSRRKATIDLRKRKKLLERYKKVIKKLSSSQRKLANIIHQLVYLKDHRDDIRFKTTYYLRKFYEEIAIRSGLNLESIVYLTNDEIIKSFKAKNNLKIRNKILARKNGYVIKKDLNKISILTGKIAKHLLNNIISKVTKEKFTQIEGVIATKGKVKGKVVVVRNDLDFRKVKTGSILVTGFTRPHYLPIMRKSAAIVTDEGGLTSHAAIVSRELGIPCIIGTKIATEVLKDGQLVEVDANKGIVRIIRDK